MCSEAWRTSRRRRSSCSVRSARGSLVSFFAYAESTAGAPALRASIDFRARGIESTSDPWASGDGRAAGTGGMYREVAHSGKRLCDRMRSMPATRTRRVPPAKKGPARLRLLDAYWRAANFLSLGQIYLLDNPLLRRPLALEHVKPRLLGHWGTTPGLNFVYAHANRAIVDHGLDAFFICGPGHGGPGVVANV